MPRNPLIIPLAAVSAVCAVSLIGNIVQSATDLRQPPAQSQQTTESTVSQDTAPEITAPQSTVPFEETAPEDDVRYIYIYDNGNEQREYPLLEGVELNDYNMGYLYATDDKRRSLYDEEGNKRSRFGIDVSAHQGFIDWEKVAADGVEFAFIRIGYRGYETGRIVEDALFRDNIAEAAAAGIDVGVYFFSQAISAEEGAEEAEFVLSILDEAKAELDLPIVFDWEFPGEGDPARTDDITGEIQTAACIEFCKTVKAAGHEPMFYSTVNTALFRYDLTQLTDYHLWLAEYAPLTAFPYKYKIWQYSSSGDIDGIDAFTDINIMID